MNDIDVLELVDKDELITFVCDNIGGWDRFDQEAIVDKLDPDVVKFEAEERDMMPTLKDLIDEQGSEVDVLGEVLDFGYTTLEVDWLEKKLKELKESIESFKYLNEVK